MRIPVYQLTFGYDKQNDRLGLTFSTEEEEDNQSLVYAVPYTHPFHFHPLELIEYFKANDFYFPIEINGEYTEVTAKINFPELIFNVPGTEYKIAFRVDLDDYDFWHRFYHREKLKYTYIGKSKNLFPKNNGFLILQPIDLLELDELYLKHKGIFVGLTPNFGEKEKLYFE